MHIDTDAPAEYPRWILTGEDFVAVADTHFVILTAEVREALETALNDRSDSATDVAEVRRCEFAINDLMNARDGEPLSPPLVDAGLYVGVFVEG